jgi:hypothetical protein
MTIGRFELKLNTWTLFTKEPKGSNWWVSKGFPFVTLSLRVPSITFPVVQRRNEWSEWERTFAISAPTLIQLNYYSDISWEGHLMLLGFGISFIYQFGY